MEDKMRYSLIYAASALLLSASAACGSGLPRGQYSIGGLQSVCIGSAGSWYGTTFNFNGRWNDSRKLNIVAALYSNYIVTGRDGNANDTITIIAKNGHLFASWYDWFDDGSYVQYLPQAVVTFEKTQCNGPFNGRNATAATQ
jgi:hypothetical protein